MKRLITDTIKYLTNHVINHIPSYTLRYTWYRNVLGWQIGPRAVIIQGLYVQMSGVRSSGKKVCIGKGSVINHSCLLHTTGGITIGDNVSISAGAWLVSGSHDMNDPNHVSIYKPIVIGNYAWIGMRSMVLGGITVGEGAVVMAGAVVTRDIEPYTVVAGVPAKVIGERKLRNPSYELDFHPFLG